MVLADRVPSSKSTTRVVTTASAVLILYTILSFGILPTMTITPRLRGGIPALYMQPALPAIGGIQALYMQPALPAIGGLRGSASTVTENDKPRVDEDDECLGTCAFVEVLAVLVSIIALVSNIPRRRSPTAMTTTCCAIP